MSEFVMVASVSEIPEKCGKCVHVKGKAIGLFNVGGTIHAIDDVCPHAEASLSAGVLSGDEIACPLHFATFNVTTGECTGPPADDDLQTYPVRIVNGDEIEVKV